MWQEVKAFQPGHTPLFQSPSAGQFECGFNIYVSQFQLEEFQSPSAGQFECGSISREELAPYLSLKVEVSVPFSGAI